MILLVFLCYIASSSGIQPITIDTDAGNPYGKIIPRFWASTGLCPPLPHEKASLYFLSEDMKQNLALIGGLSENGDMQIRIHWLLQLVTMTINHETVTFNFTLLDQLLDRIKLNGLKPGFEMMGNPNNLFRNFENKTEVKLWYHLVKELATRYIDRYGIDYVKTWNFESWNEPDNHDFDNLTMTLKGLLNYYDATSEGLLAADQNLRLGGPANRLVFKRSPMSLALLQHCYNGTNYFTNQSGIRLDFISIHQKGNGTSLTILREEIKIFNYIKQLFPNYTNLRFYNDEADPLVGWNKPLTWRGDTTYAAIIAKVISQHWHICLRSDNPLPTYSLLSNDNAFLSYQPQIFEQRTLTARFQINNTAPPFVILIRKPAYNVFKLLSYLGDTPIPLSISVNGSEVPINSSNVGAIATIRNRQSIQNNWYFSTLLYYSNDTNITSDVSIKIKFNISNLPSGINLTACWYIMENTAKTNPFAVWKQIGRPATPTRRQLRQMMNSQDPIRKGPFDISASSYSMKFKFSSPGVRLIHICEKPLKSPETVTNIHIYNITNNIVLIFWKSSSVNKCIKTFEIELSKTNSFGPYEKINKKETIFTTFHYIPKHSSGEQNKDANVRGFYRIRAIDYWTRAGPYSIPIKYGL